MLRFQSLAIVLVSGCYAPSYVNCELACAGESCPSGFACSAGKCAAEGKNCNGLVGDGGLPDGSMVQNFHDITWPVAEPIANTVDPERCEWSPRLDTSMSLLLFARATVDLSGTDPEACRLTASIVAASWNNGHPEPGAEYPVAVAQTDPSVNPVALFKRGQDHELLYEARTSIASGPRLYRETRAAELTDNPATPTVFAGGIAGARPAFSAALDLAVVDSSGGDIFETRGTYPEYPAGTGVESVNSGGRAASPAISPDGRVMVFVRFFGSESDLYVVRRLDVRDAWGAPQLIPYSSQVNQGGSYEYDPFIAANGDLVFSSTRAADGRRRLYLARAVP